MEEMNEVDVLLYLNETEYRQKFPFPTFPSLPVRDRGLLAPYHFFLFAFIVAIMITFCGNSSPAISGCVCATDTV